MPAAGRVAAGVTRTGEFRIFDAPLLRVEQDGEAVTHLDFGAHTGVLNFTAVDGNDDVERLSWEVASSESPWLSVSNAGDMVAVSVNRRGLVPGDYIGTFHHVRWRQQGVAAHHDARAARRGRWMRRSAGASRRASGPHARRSCRPADGLPDVRAAAPDAPGGAGVT